MKFLMYNQKCLLSEYISGSTHQYKLQCGTESACNGGFRRRDVTTHCCSENKCNTPDFGVTSTTTTTMTTTTTTTTRPTTTSTTKPTTTTTTPKPTTRPVGPYSDCSRDIIVMVEDSKDTTVDSNVKRFLSDIVNSIPIGPDGSIMALARFGSRIYAEWEFSHTQTKEELIRDIWGIEFINDFNRVDFEDFADEVSFFMRTSHGDRDTVPDVVLVISDYGRYLHGSGIFSGGFGGGSSGGTGDRKRFFRDTDNIPGDNTIVINVGREAIHSGVFTDQATGSDHVIEVSSYLHLSDNVQRVIDLICA